MCGGGYADDGMKREEQEQRERGLWKKWRYSERATSCEPGVV